MPMTKNNTELRLFIPDKWVQSNNEWKIIEPQKPSNITVEDLSGKLSNYQKLQCKKAFLKIANEINPDFNIKNYWVMEMIKHTIQPIDKLLEWSCHRCFCKPDKFSNIWVPDFLKANEEPYFFITDSPYLQYTTKIATLNFKTADYHTTGIYKNNVKRKIWKLDKNYINELIEFLHSPSTRVQKDYYINMYSETYKKTVKTMWQELIFEYNYNTAGCNLSQEEDIKALSCHLEMPDYTKLVKNLN